MATKIENKGNKIIFTGHEENKKQCELTTLLCDALASSKDFKTIRYENGYAEFEKIGKAKELKFFRSPGSIDLYDSISGDRVLGISSDADVSVSFSGNIATFTITGGLMSFDYTNDTYIESYDTSTGESLTATFKNNIQNIVLQDNETQKYNIIFATSPSPTINLDNLARFKSKLDATYMGINDVAANPGSYTAILSTITILGKNYNILPQASSMALGGIKIGYPQSGKNYPVQLSTSGQAYVNVPWTDADVTAQKIFNLTEDSDTVVREIDSDTGKVNIHLATTVTNKVNNALQMPTTKPTELLMVGLNTNKAQTNIPLGASLALENGHLETAIKIVRKTQEEYNNLTSYDANTMYVIVG